MSDLKHYGTPQHSGRYPWGSGNDPYQRTSSFVSYVESLKKEGLSEAEIAKGLGMKSTELRRQVSNAKAELREADYSQALRLKNKGYSHVAIGERMGRNESSVRSLLDPAIRARARITEATANVLKEHVQDKKFIDIGKGVENHLGISRVKLQNAVQKLKDDEGYKVHYLQVMQAGTGKKTSLMVLTAPDVEWTDVNQNKDKIEMPIEQFSKDGGRTYQKPQPIQHLKSSEVLIRFGDEGGADKDGTLELRRGVDHLDLGKAHYAQVRVGVDGTHFMKGMAMYTDDIPDGVNVIYNTNKPTGTPPEKVFKPLTEDPKNPFGAVIKKDGHRGALNVLNEEGDWEQWSKSLSSQFLGKQKPALIKQQLDLALKIKEEEYEQIINLTNPTIKKRLLYAFADDADALAVDLKAAALPRQGSYVVLPFPKMKPNEVYAPMYKDGEEVALIRHPHGGIFEIPLLKVNNRQKDIINVIGRPRDAIGIHPKTAEQLSGADFDGDSVIVIPTKGKNITASSPLKQLQNFDPRELYPLPDSVPKMKKGTKQNEMGKISNLITDMTIRGADQNEIAAAVKHSMVVIDAEKHHLNYKQSFKDNNIALLKKRYQGAENAGASTLLSRASSDLRVDERSDYFKIDPKTGKKVYEYTGESYVNKKGKTIVKKTKTTRMAEAKDAFELSSGTRQEAIYAEFANALKSLANKSRKDSIETPKLEYSPSANKTYAKEVESLKAKLNIAERNAPLERKAQTIAEKQIALKIEANPDMEKDKLKKIRSQEIIEARERVGANKTRVDIEPNEWAAIQAGAVFDNTLVRILDNTDLDVIKKYATPRETNTLSPAKLNKAKAMLKSGHTQAEVAESIGVSPSTIAKILE